MELPKIMKSEHGGMLDGIKSKLGFADARAERDDYGDYGDDYGDYGDDYGDYGPEHDDDSAPASRYDPYAPVTTRPARRSGAHASRSSSSEFPKLVSIDDVRANTQVPDSLRRDPLPPRRVTGVSSSSYRGERTVIDTMSPAPSSPASTERIARSDTLASTTTDLSAPRCSTTSGRSSPSSAFRVTCRRFTELQGLDEVRPPRQVDTGPRSIGVEHDPTALPRVVTISP